MMRYRKTPQPRDCTWCGRHYRPAALNGKYCCAGCADKAAQQKVREYQARKRQAKAERTCAACGKTYVPSHGLQLSCSDECKQARQRQTSLQWYAGTSKGKPKDRLCAVCQTPFVASGHRMRAVTCSPECSYLRSREHTRRIKIEQAAQDPDIDAIIKRKQTDAYRARKRMGTVQHRTHCRSCLGPLPMDGTARTTCSLTCAGRARQYAPKRRCP